MIQVKKGVLGKADEYPQGCQVPGLPAASLPGESLVQLGNDAAEGAEQSTPPAPHYQNNLPASMTLKGISVPEMQLLVGLFRRGLEASISTSTLKLSLLACKPSLAP